MKVAMSLAGVAFVLAAPAVAHAFTDPQLFVQGVDKGGADHRYFTGSRADKYACSACHEGGAPLDLTITGLPEGIPAAGVRYDVTIRWDHPETPVALQLELTRKSGGHPSVAIPDPLPAEARCDAKADGMAAEYILDEGTRRIVGVTDCNASAVVFSFLGDGQPIDLAVAGVRSDASETPAGDGTFELRTTIGQKLIASGGGCDGGGGGAGLLAGLAAALSLTASGRRRAR